MDDLDELNDPEVRARLAALRGDGEAVYRLVEGRDPPPSNAAVDAVIRSRLPDGNRSRLPDENRRAGHWEGRDACGRGPSSPFYQPGFRPTWAAADWTPPHWVEDE
jgi:hypothetical protein